jgi:hypothetical protein
MSHARMIRIFPEHRLQNLGRLELVRVGLIVRQGRCIERKGIKNLRRGKRLVCSSEAVLPATTPLLPNGAA